MKNAVKLDVSRLLGYRLIKTAGLGSKIGAPKPPGIGAKIGVVKPPP